VESQFATIANYDWHCGTLPHIYDIGVYARTDPSWAANHLQQLRCMFSYVKQCVTTEAPAISATAGGG
uniref:Uncharacterized protein n=1 Tax=Aegilops tauschii subsp. strangulata TaxID=200361 RepID=A0A453Q0S4_AEGTS